MSENKTKNKYKIQISLQLIIILSLVAIIALISASLYLSSTHKVSVASLGDIISAQASSSNTLVLKLTEPLPSGTQIESINLTGVPPGTTISVSLENQTPVYNDGYPEYTFSVSGLPEPLPYYNVTSLTYEANGRTIVVPTITGEPVAIEETSEYNGGSTLPSGIIAYVPITISNKQNVATPSPFQQMIQINEGNYASYITYNGNIANFEFFTQSGQVLPAWIESNNSGNLIIWVKIPGIPAKHSKTIYLGFASQKTNLLSSSGTTGIGEAPQLSCPNPDNTANCPTYAEYDDGASVFKNYWNFAGTTLPNGWAEEAWGGPWCYPPTITYNVNNGLSVSPTPCQWSYQYVYYTKLQSLSPTGIVFDLYGNYSTNSFGGVGIPFLGSTQGTIQPGYMAWIGYDSSTNKFTDFIFNIVYGYGADTPVTFSTAKQVWTFYSIGKGIVLVNNYTAQTVSTGNNFPAPVYTLQGYMGVNAGNGETATMFIQWWRIRALPPNGVMPSVSFGSVQQTL